MYAASKLLRCSYNLHTYCKADDVLLLLLCTKGSYPQRQKPPGQSPPLSPVRAQVEGAVYKATMNYQHVSNEFDYRAYILTVARIIMALSSILYEIHTAVGRIIMALSSNYHGSLLELSWLSPLELSRQQWFPESIYHVPVPAFKLINFLAHRRYNCRLRHGQDIAAEERQR